MASIRLHEISKRYGSVEAVRDLTLTCVDGELLALLGPSGCGKSSTLKMIAGVEDPSAGEIYFDDRAVTALDSGDRNVAMVFEDYALYPHLTVAQNVAFPLEVRRRPPAAVRRAVDEVLQLLGLEALRDVGVRALSGGAQQRVAIGRALVREPAVILFDEPLSHLDASHKVQLRAEIKRLQKEAAVTGVLVTHDQTEAMAMADRVAVMATGTLQQLGPPHELYERPANLFVARFVGEPPMNLLHGELSSSGGGLAVAGRGWQACLPAESAGRIGRAGPAVVVGVRPEHLHLAPAGAGPTARGMFGQVTFREIRGDTDVLLIQVAGEPGAEAEGPDRDGLTAEVPARSPWRAGDRVAVTLSGADLHVFDAQTGANVLDGGGGRAAA